MAVQGTLDNGRTVFLWNQDEQMPLVIEIHKAEEGQTPGLGHLAFYVDDVQAAYDELSSVGIAFCVQSQYGSASGRTIAVTEDPDGTPIQLAHKTTRGEYEDFR